MILQNPNLLQTQAYIDGQWQPAIAGATFPVLNPFSGEAITTIADGAAEDTKRAVQAAHQAQPAWAALTANKRAKYLRRWHALILENLEDLALLLTCEQGKPLAEARGEIRYGASFIEWFAEEARRAYGDVIPNHAKNLRVMVVKQPVGVVAAITPWNFPNAMITRKVAPALAAGCTIVVKPAEDTPLSALALAVLAEAAGIPLGVFNVVPTSQPAAVGEVLTTSPVVRKLSFTGSTAVGKLLAQQCAGTVKKLSLELGGNAPFIVFADADLDAAVAGAMTSKFRNAGQTCICANRLFVQEAVYDEFVLKFCQAMNQLQVGDGRAAGTSIGPLINNAAVEKVQRLLQDAQHLGATIRYCTNTIPDHPRLLTPCLLTEVTTKMKVATTEIFGPVAPIFKFTTEEEVIQLANAIPEGLAAYFYGANHARIWRVAEALEFGMVGINTGMISTTVAPFGGIKESGYGREGSYLGMEEYLVTKYLCWNVE
ncbi:MAG: NAD-dependent succinate-semialdehyde dehydrogenase [Bacteroidota bacterium]